VSAHGIGQVMESTQTKVSWWRRFALILTQQTHNNHDVGSRVDGLTARWSKQPSIDWSRTYRAGSTAKAAATKGKAKPVMPAEVGKREQSKAKARPIMSAEVRKSEQSKALCQPRLKIIGNPRPHASRGWGKWALQSQGQL